MAHICRWRFPARPVSGVGRRLGRARVTAALRSGSGNAAELGGGFDAALGVCAELAHNASSFRGVYGDTGGSSGEEDDKFDGFVDVGGVTSSSVPAVNPSRCKPCPSSPAGTKVGYVPVSTQVKPKRDQPLFLGKNGITSPIEPRRRRGRPPSVPRPQAESAVPSAIPSALRVRPGGMRGVRVTLPHKRADAARARLLLQRARKGAQAKRRMDGRTQGDRRHDGRTPLKNIRQFIMPVVSTVSLRVIKTPKRFMEDGSSQVAAHRQMQSRVSALHTAPASPPRPASATSKSSLQSESSSPDLSPQRVVHGKRDCLGRGGGPSALPGGRRRSILSPATVDMLSSWARSQKPPTPAFLSASLDGHPPPPWLMPHPVPPLMPVPTVLPCPPRGQRSILREPTFRWTSRSQAEPQRFSSAKYAKEGLIRKPVFDNFQPPPLTAEDVGLALPPSTAGLRSGGQLCSSLLLHPRSHLVVPTTFGPLPRQRGPLLRAPRFTPSEAHSRIFESLTLPSSQRKIQTPPPTSRSARVLRLGRRKSLEHQKLSSHMMSTRKSPSGASLGLSLAPGALTSPSFGSLDWMPPEAFWTAGRAGSCWPPSSSQMFSQRAQVTSNGGQKQNLLHSGLEEPPFASDTELSPGDLAPKPVSRESTPTVECHPPIASSNQRPSPGESGEEQQVPGRPTNEQGSPVSSTPRSGINRDTDPEESGPLKSEVVVGAAKKKSDPSVLQKQETELDKAGPLGPRIKHVCRRAAVALGRPRAVFPDDTPTLSALPWKEREKVLSSPNEGVNSTARQEDEESQSSLGKPSTVPRVRHKKGRRSRRCGQCPGCRILQDCGVCPNCLDKPKFGGPNVKKQCCKVRKCQRLHCVPSKTFNRKQSQGSGEKKKKKKPNLPEQSGIPKPESLSLRLEKPEPADQEAPSTVLCRDANQELPQLPVSSACVVHETKQRAVTALSPSSPAPCHVQTVRLVTRDEKDESCRSKAESDVKKVKQQVLSEEQKFHVKERPVAHVGRNIRWQSGVCGAWQTGGRSVVTFGPLAPRPLCFLCASSGTTEEFVFCQVCCEPFHCFCLEDNERPLCHELENWCCRRCRYFCAYCRTQSKERPLLQCDQCRKCCHPECLTPPCPAVPPGEAMAWVCPDCVSRGAAKDSGPTRGEEAPCCHDSRLSCDSVKPRKNGCPNLLPWTGSPDRRRCALCLQCGDCNDNNGGRLLHVCQDEWIHVNCALWSAGVSEERDGFLRNVYEALKRGRQERCRLCHQPGATVRCSHSSCSSSCHFPCARQNRFIFLQNGDVYCQRHGHRVQGAVISGSGFEVKRKIVVDVGGIGVKLENGVKAEMIRVLIGAMAVDCLGMLTDMSDCEHQLFPVGYRCSRVYWSTRDAQKQCIYTCRILSKCASLSKMETLPPSSSGASAMTTLHIESGPQLSATKSISQESNPFHISPSVCPVNNVQQHTGQDRTHLHKYSTGGRRPRGKSTTCARALPAESREKKMSPCHQGARGMEQRRGSYMSNNNESKLGAGFLLKGVIGSSSDSCEKSRGCLEQNLSPDLKAGKKISLLVEGKDVHPQETKGNICSRHVQPSHQKRTTKETDKNQAKIHRCNLPDLHHGETKSSEIIKKLQIQITAGSLKAEDKSNYSEGKKIAHEERMQKTSLKKNSNGSVSDSSSLSSSFHMSNSQRCPKQGPSRDSKFSTEGQLESVKEVSSCSSRDRYTKLTRSFQSFTTGSVPERRRVASKAKGLVGPRIKQLDGIDDGSESDTSVSAGSTSADTSFKLKSSSKKKGKERQVHPDTRKVSESSRKGQSSRSKRTQKQSFNPVERGKDPLETHLSLSTDSDNATNDDYGTILPSDIMEFVLNTPSMQSLGQQPETSPSDLLSLDEGFRLDGSRSKDMALFDHFHQQSTDGGLSTSITEEEPYSLPLELPSDLSGLTGQTSADGQNSGNVVLANQSNLSISPNATVSTTSAETDQATEGHHDVRESLATLETFVPRCSESIHVPSSPSEPLEQEHKDLIKAPVMSDFPNPPHLPLPGISLTQVPVSVSSTVIPTAPENVLVVNQHLQPICILQAVPGGVAQEIRMAPSVTGAGGMDSNTAVLTSLTGGLQVSSGTAASQEPQIHAFTGTTQTGFSPGLSHTTSGFLLGVNAHNPHILVPKAVQQVDLVPSVAVVTSGSSSSTSAFVLKSDQGLKRPISRLQPRRVKKLACREVTPNTTLINLTPSSLPTGMSTSSVSADLGSLGTAPSSVLTPKPGVIYLEPTSALLPQGGTVQIRHPGFFGAGQAQLVPCTVQRARPSQPMVNMVSVPGGGSAALLGQSLVRSEQPVLLQTGNPQLPSGGSICPSQFPAHGSMRALSSTDQQLSLDCTESVSSDRAPVPPSSSLIKQEPALSHTHVNTRKRSHTTSATGTKKKIKLFLPDAPQKEEEATVSISVTSVHPISTTSLHNKQDPKSERTECDRLSESELPSRGKARWDRLFELSSDDGFFVQSESIEDVWKAVTDRVQEVRRKAQLQDLCYEAVNGMQMLGLIHRDVLQLLEQLCEANHQDSSYFHRGSARTQLYCRKSKSDTFTFLTSEHRHLPPSAATSGGQLAGLRHVPDLPLPERLMLLKGVSREVVGVYRSAIHGRGLYCKRDIDAGEMIMEYTGSVIRSVLASQREMSYRRRGVGSYMFRMDSQLVVDATRCGNAARFINHSCEPNCQARVLETDGRKHILIFALHRIRRGQELTYDYSFPLEGPDSKMPCSCGAAKCRQFLN